MKRLLLTQSQVSVILSCAVVFAFTAALFFSGYVLQQRTVTGLQAALKPRMPKPPPSLSAQNQQETVDLQPSRFFKGNGKVSYTRKVDSLDAGPEVDWTKLAHVQIARSHHDVCSAVMVLAELHKQKSPARRILMFPLGWAEEKIEKGDLSDPYMASSRRLLRLAARRYGVELHPMSPIGMRMKDTGEEEGIYSLASAFELTALERVLNIETPGMLLDSRPLDAVLAFTEKAPFAILQQMDDGNGGNADDLILLQPSGPMHTELVNRLLEVPSYNDTQFTDVFTEPLQLASGASSESALVRSIGVLHDAPDNFNGTEWLSDVAYIRFSDPKLPGPEYDVPWSDKVAARPKSKKADWTWTKMYGEFSLKRMEICGLDLETWIR